MTKEEICLLCFCMSSSLVIMFHTLLPTLTKHGMKYPLVIRQYGAGFGNYSVSLRILEIKRADDIHLKFSINI